MIDRVVLEQACRAHDEARDALVRSPKTDAGYYRKYTARDDALDRLVHLLTLHGVPYHHEGQALWVEHGELHRAGIEAGLPNRKRKGIKK